jgi:nucleoside-diphosphate-sugar epimerase
MTHPVGYHEARRVLLTGAAGFIGAQIARALLERGAEVHAVVIDRADIARLAAIESSITIHEADLLEADARGRVVDNVKPELCVHASWYAVPGKYLESKENLNHLGASLDLATRLVEAGCKRFVGLGTCFEYDLRATTAPLSETSPTGPTFLYSTSKLALYDMLSAYAKLAPTSFAWCRVFYPYGPMEAPERLVPHVIGKLLSGAFADTSEGAQVRDYLHVADVGAAIATVALSDVQGAINIGSGVPVAVREVVETIARICKATDRVRYGAVPYRPGDPMYVCADVAKLRQIGFTPRFDLESGLRDTIENQSR